MILLPSSKDTDELMKRFPDSRSSLGPAVQTELHAQFVGCTLSQREAAVEPAIQPAQENKMNIKENKMNIKQNKMNIKEKGFL